MEKHLSLSGPDITEAERTAVLDVLKTPSLALGPRLKEFEDNFARYIGTKYAVAVNSGTSGLHLLVRALGIGEGDEVITTPFSFISSANCALFEKAKPVFTDIDPVSLNIDPSKIEVAITKKTKAIIAVDLLGYPVEWDSITKIARRHGLKIIEDSCEALGAEYKEVRCGNFGAAAVFAFYPNKQMTTGEGGMIVTDDKDIADLCRSMANQGREAKNGKWLEHVRLGYNYRMSDINAALGNAQLARIGELLQKRDDVAAMYESELKDNIDLSLLKSEAGKKRSWFVYLVTLSERYSREDKETIIKKMGEKGIQCGDYFQCIHLQPFYRQSFGYQRGLAPVAESVSDRTIALPFYSNLGRKDVEYVVQNLGDIMKQI